MAQVGDEVWVGGRCNIYAYNADTYFQEGVFPAHTGDVHVIMSPSPNRAWTASDVDIRVWQREEGSLIHLATLKIHTGKVICLGTAEGLVWSGSFDTNIIIWDAEVRASSQSWRRLGVVVILIVCACAACNCADLPTSARAYGWPPRCGQDHLAQCHVCMEWFNGWSVGTVAASAVASYDTTRFVHT
jgi:hypothetical protein